MAKTTPKENKITGRSAFLALLKDEGVTTLFGNPGTTELPVMHALKDHPDMHYVMGMQESIVVYMADGYSRGSGKLSACNVHVAPGLGNAMGALYSAKFTGTPMILTAGQQEQGHGLTEPLLYDPLVPIAQPLVKWAVEVTRLEDLPRIMRRAAKVAMTPPTGPVFISLPGDILNNEAGIDLLRGHPRRHARPPLRRGDRGAGRQTAQVRQSRDVVRRRDRQERCARGSRRTIGGAGLRRLPIDHSLWRALPVRAALLRRRFEPRAAPGARRAEPLRHHARPWLRRLAHVRVARDRRQARPSQDPAGRPRRLGDRQELCDGNGDQGRRQGNHQGADPRAQEEGRQGARGARQERHRRTGQDELDRQAQGARRQYREDEHVEADSRRLADPSSRRGDAEEWHYRQRGPDLDAPHQQPFRLS